MSELLLELQEVRDEATAAKEQLDNYMERCNNLQEELKVCNCVLILLLWFFMFPVADGPIFVCFLGKSRSSRKSPRPTAKGTGTF